MYLYQVQFPGFGISVNVNPVAFTIGNHSFTWYGIIIAVGFLLAFLYALKSCRPFHMDEDKFTDAVIAGIIGGIIGARLYYVIFDASSAFVENPISIFYIWDGGIGIYGGIIGGMLFGAIMAKIRKVSVPAVLDLASMGFLIGQAIGRWGNFTNQEAFGTATTLPWRMISENTENYSSTGVHPCFLYESLWCLVGFILLHFFSRKLRRYDGQVFLLYSIWYGIGRFFIEGLRTDSLITPNFINHTYRISQVVAAAAVVIAAVLLIVFRKKTSLTGCGSKKIMELNSISDEIAAMKAEKIEKAKAKAAAKVKDDGTSTIFQTGDDAKKLWPANPYSAEAIPKKAPVPKPPRRETPQSQPGQTPRRTVPFRRTQRRRARRRAAKQPLRGDGRAR
jgi:phosphatidylglycerol:prolipoprotein diacylglycerol transferase